MKPALLKLALKKKVQEEPIPLEDIEAELPDLPDDDTDFDLDWDRAVSVSDEKEPTVLENVMNRFKKKLFSPKSRQSDTSDGDQDLL